MKYAEKQGFTEHGYDRTNKAGHDWFGSKRAELRNRDGNLEEVTQPKTETNSTSNSSESVRNKKSILDKVKLIYKKLFSKKSSESKPKNNPSSEPENNNPKPNSTEPKTEPELELEIEPGFKPKIEQVLEPAIPIEIEPKVVRPKLPAIHGSNLTPKQRKIFN
jgi:hypothetical protein